MTPQPQPAAIRFTVPGQPVAQPRANATSFAGHARMYTPTKTPKGKSNGIAEFKALVRRMAAEAHTGAPLDGPLEVEIVAVFLRPGKPLKTKPMPRRWHAVRPDADNVAKAILDALRGIAWRDDTQVALLSVRKLVAAGHEQPGTLVTVRELGAAE